MKHATLRHGLRLDASSSSGRGRASQDGASGRRTLRCGGVARRRRLVADARPVPAGAVLALGDLAVHGGDVPAAAGPRGLAARPALHLVAHG